jgi:hypothetical protein
MLSAFAALNATAVTKILKKHDKMSGWETARAYMPLMDGVHFRVADHAARAACARCGVRCMRVRKPRFAMSHI